MWIYLNGAFVPQERAHLSIFDHGFLYGDGAFETVRAYQGRFLSLDRHLARLRRSCQAIDLPVSVPDPTWPSLLSELLSRNGLNDAQVRITISRGEGPPGLDPALCDRPTVVVMALPAPTYPPSLKRDGVRVEIVEIRRNPRSAQSPRIKSLSCLNNILAKQEALRRGAFDALMLNVDGMIAECTTSNVFFVQRGTLCTPSVECGILDGVTREIVVDLARAHGLPVEDGHYAARELLDAEECFLTNTGMEIMPVCQVGDRRVGTRCPGPLTDRISRLFREEVERLAVDPLAR